MESWNGSLHGRDFHLALAVHDQEDARREGDEPEWQRDQPRGAETAAAFGAADGRERRARQDAHAAERREHDAADELAAAARPGPHLEPFVSGLRAEIGHFEVFVALEKAGIVLERVGHGGVDPTLARRLADRAIADDDLPILLRLHGHELHFDAAGRAAIDDAR